MRRRLISSTLAVVLVVIAVFGLSLIIVETRTIESSARDGVESEAVRLVGIVENRILAGESVDAKGLDRQVAADRYAVVRVPGHPRVTLGNRPKGKVITSTQHGDHGESVTVEQPRSTVSKEIGRNLLVILAVALLAVLAAVGLAVRQAKRLASPLSDLAATAELRA